MPGGNILDQIKQLGGQVLATPQGQAMAQAIMQQIGGGDGGGADPRVQMAQNPTGVPTGQDAGNPVANMQGGSVMGRGPATDGELEAMEGANRQMGLNPDGPTPDEVKLLQSNPSPRNIANFNKLFGPGAAEQALGVGPHGPGETDYNDNQGHTSYEDDVRGAMSDEENHRRGRYGHKGRGEPLDGTILDEDD